MGTVTLALPCRALDTDFIQHVPVAIETLGTGTVVRVRTGLAGDVSYGTDTECVAPFAGSLPRAARYKVSVSGQVVVVDEGRQARVELPITW